MNATIIKRAAVIALVFTPVLAMAQWKIKTKMNKYLHLMALLLIATSFASCHNDEPVIIDDDEEVVEKEPLPAYDIIETTVDAKTVVLQTGLTKLVLCSKIV